METIQATWLGERATPQLIWAAAGRLGWAWSALAPERRALATAQLRAALPHLTEAEAEATIQRMFHHLAALPLELLAAAAADVAPSSPDRIDLGGAGILTTLRRHHLTDALGEGRGALIVSAHVGNFELALHGEALQGVPLSVVTKRLGSPWLDRLWRRLRQGSGLEVIDDDHSLTAISGALRRGRAVVMTLDQHANREHAVTVPFFRRPAWTHRGLALLSARSGAPIVPAFATRSGPGRHTLRYMAPLTFERGGRDAREAIVHHTARCTRLIERVVRAQPDQWTWLHRRWKGEGVMGGR